MTSLTHLVLEESYVLGISVEPYRLQFSMDFVLAPEHPKYSPPMPGEVECYRRGTIRVFDFRVLTWRVSNVKPSTDAAGEIDYGCLDEMLVDGGLLTFRGDWGDIEVSEGRLAVLLDE